MKSKIAILCVVICLLVMVSRGSAQEQAGSFIIYMGEQRIGTEEFQVAEEGITTETELNVGGQKTPISTKLVGVDGIWNRYEFATTGFAFYGEMEEETVTFQVGPNQFSTPLEPEYVVLENNVFYHYQDLLRFASKDSVSIFPVVVPTLLLQNRSPVINGTMEYLGTKWYQYHDELLLLEEYQVILDSITYGHIYVNNNEDVVKIEFPGQYVKAVRSSYQGLSAVSDNEGLEAHYVDEFFEVLYDDIQLAGTLSIPTHSDGPYPVVFLNSGTGPQDRDGNSAPVLMSYMFKEMAQRYTEVGVAVMRYDERGVGESTGDYESATLSDLVGDVQVLLAYLKVHPAIDSKRIAFLGHSEGGVIGPLVMAADPTLAAGIFLGAPSITLDHIMIEQLEHQASLDELVTHREMILGYIPLIEEFLADIRAEREPAEELMNVNWMREHMAYDPIGTIQQLQVPILIVQGEKDFKVMPYHAEALANALQEAGNQEVSLEIIPNATHEFLFFSADDPRFDPKQPFKVVEDVYAVTSKWLATHLVQNQK